MSKKVVVNLKNDGTISSIAINGERMTQFGGLPVAKMDYGRIVARLEEQGYVKTGDQPHSARFEKVGLEVKEAVALIGVDGTVRQVQMPDGQRYDGVWSKAKIIERLNEMGFALTVIKGARWIFSA